MIHIGIIEDHQDTREVLTAFLTQQPGFEVQGTFPSVEAFLESAVSPDVLLMDINLPGLSGIEGIMHIKQQHPFLDIIMLTMHEEGRMIFNALCAGAIGYLVKGIPLMQIKAAIQTVSEGGSAMSPQVARRVVEYFQPRARNEDSPLTPKEHQIVSALVDGLSYKLIADRYSIGIETVRTHIKNIYKKLHVNSKSEVVAKKLRGEIK